MAPVCSPPLCAQVGLTLTAQQTPASQGHRVAGGGGWGQASRKGSRTGNLGATEVRLQGTPVATQGGPLRETQQAWVGISDAQGRNRRGAGPCRQLRGEGHSSAGRGEGAGEGHRAGGCGGGSGRD